MEHARTRTHTDTHTHPHTVGLLCANDRAIPDISTSQDTTVTRKRLPRYPAGVEPTILATDCKLILCLQFYFEYSGN